MAKYQWQIEGNDPDSAPTQEWMDTQEQERKNWIENAPPYAHVEDPAFNDPQYKALETLDFNAIEEAASALKNLVDRYPDSWSLKTLYGSQLMRGPNIEEGEKILREQTRNPLSPEAHVRLGNLLKHYNRYDEAMVFCTLSSFRSLDFYSDLFGASSLKEGRSNRLYR